MGPRQIIGGIMKYVCPESGTIPKCKDCAHAEPHGRTVRCEGFCSDTAIEGKSLAVRAIKCVEASDEEKE